MRLLARELLFGQDPGVGRLGYAACVATVALSACTSDNPLHGVSTTSEMTADGSTTQATTGTTSSSSSGGSAGVTSSSTSAAESSSGGASTGPVEMPQCGVQEILADAPVLYWRLGESEGTVAADASDNGQDGTYSNVAYGEPGVAWDGDGAIRFNGVLGSMVQLYPVGPFPTTEMTVEFWVRSTAQDGGFVSYATTQDDNDIYIDDPDGLDLLATGRGVETLVDFADGEWHHLACIWDSGGQYRILLDGAVVAADQGLAVGESIAPGGSLILGQDQDEIGGMFEEYQALDGALDEFVVFDRALPVERVQAHRLAIECPAG